MYAFSISTHSASVGTVGPWSWVYYVSVQILRVTACMRFIPKMNPGAVSLLTPAGIWVPPTGRMMHGDYWQATCWVDLGTLLVKPWLFPWLPSRFHRWGGRLESLVCLQRHLWEWQPEADQVLRLRMHCHRVSDMWSSKLPRWVHAGVWLQIQVQSCPDWDKRKVMGSLGERCWRWKMFVTVNSSSCHSPASFCVVHTCLRRCKEEGGGKKELEKKKDKEKEEYVTKTICAPQSMKYLLVLSDPLQKVY